MGGRVGRLYRRVLVSLRSGELFPRVGLFVTNLKTVSRALVGFYINRGTAEQWIKESKQAVEIAR